MAADDKIGNATPELPPTASPKMMGQPGNGDFNRDRFVDCARDGSTRVLLQDATMDINFEAKHDGELEEANPDMWGIQRPIGGTPDPNVGRPR